jgi:hypothetical protein
MFWKLKTWFTIVFFILMGAYLVNSGLPLIFSTPLTFFGSIFAVTMVNIIVMALMSNAKTVKVDKSGFPWIVSHNKWLKYPLLVLIWIAEMSLFSHFLSEKGVKSESGILILIFILSIVSAGTISLGKRK